MDREPLPLLLIDDSEAETEQLVRKPASGGYDPGSIRGVNAQAPSQVLLYGSWDLAVGDPNRPGFNGTAALKQITEHDPNLPSLFVSARFPPIPPRSSRPTARPACSPSTSWRASSGPSK